jgi:hypothetical protein
VPVLPLARQRARRGWSARRLDRTMAGLPRPARAARMPIAAERPDECRSLRNRLPGQRSKCENCRRRYDDRNGQCGEKVQPRIRPVRLAASRQEPARRARPHHPQTPAGCTQFCVQPRPEKPEPAERVTDHLAETGCRPGGRPRVRRGQPDTDPLQPVLGGLYRVRCRFEHTSQNLFMVTAVLVHASFSSTLCSADMARAM